MKFPTLETAWKRIEDQIPHLSPQEKFRMRRSFYIGAALILEVILPNLANESVEKYNEVFNNLEKELSIFWELENKVRQKNILQ